MANTVDEFLEHHGVKGMKWGVRKDKDDVKRTSYDFTGLSKEEVDDVMTQLKKDLGGGGGSGREITEEERQRQLEEATKNLEAAADKANSKKAEERQKFKEITINGETMSAAEFERALAKAEEKKNNHWTKKVNSFFKTIGLPEPFQTVTTSSTSEKKVKVVKHDFDTEVDDFLAHYGVKGMKWGIRKDRSGRRRSTTQVLAEERRQSRKSNSLSSNPRNKRMTDSQMREIINRIELEQKLSRLTAPQKAPPNRLKGMMKDVAFDVTKGALTEVGKLALSQALKVNYNKVAGPEYKIAIKKIQEAIDKAND